MRADQLDVARELYLATAPALARSLRITMTGSSDGTVTTERRYSGVRGRDIDTAGVIRATTRVIGLLDSQPDPTIEILPAGVAKVRLLDDPPMRISLVEVAPGQVAELVRVVSTIPAGLSRTYDPATHPRWSSSNCLLRQPVEVLELAVEFPPEHAPAEWRAVWSMGVSARTEAIIEPLGPAAPCLSWELRPGKAGAELFIERPLPGFAYTLGWIAPETAAYEAAQAGAR